MSVVSSYRVAARSHGAGSDPVFFSEGESSSTGASVCVLSKSLGVCNSVGASSCDVLGVFEKKLVIADAMVS
jgi:hypothetical protein